MLTAADYRPPRLLRNPHLQSVLGSSGLRRHRGLRALAASGAVTAEHILDGGHFLLETHASQAAALMSDFLSATSPAPANGSRPTRS